MHEMCCIDLNRKIKTIQHIRTGINRQNILIAEYLWALFWRFLSISNSLTVCLVFRFSVDSLLASCEVYLIQSYRWPHQISYDLSTWFKYQAIAGIKSVLIYGWLKSIGPNRFKSVPSTFDVDKTLMRARAFPCVRLHSQHTLRK